MKSQYIRLILVLFLGLSACIPTPVTPSPLPTIVPSETPKPPDTPVPSNSPVPIPVPSIKITNPINKGPLSCDNPPTEVFCTFHVQGNISGLGSFADYRVYVFVKPVSPSGVGWYLQKSPASIQSNGDWDQSPAYLGNNTFPAKNGDTLLIRAALVKADATYKGTPLADLANLKEEIILAAVEDIDGDVAVADTVSLTLSK